MIELALVLILLVMLLVGTVTAAVAYGRNNSIQNAAREASRFAATLPPPIDTAWLQQVRDVARAAAAGDLDTSIPGQFICVAHIDGTTMTIRSLEDSGGSESEPNTQCFSDGRPADESRVQVVVARDTDIEAIVFSTTIDLTAEAAARYER